jgi:hypothetical protein
LAPRVPVKVFPKGSQISSEATEVVAKDSFGAGIASDGIIANERALKNRNIYYNNITPIYFPVFFKKNWMIMYLKNFKNSMSS